MFEYKLIMKYLSGKERESASKDLPESEYKKIVEEEMKHILRDNIPFFKNITIRRDFTLNIQLSNVQLFPLRNSRILSRSTSRSSAGTGTRCPTETAKNNS
jgi:hypothetical protein